MGCVSPLLKIAGLRIEVSSDACMQFGGSGHSGDG